MRKWQRSMRRILAVIVAVALLGGNMEWTTLKVSATEENPPVVTEGEEITVEVSPEIEYMELPELQTSAVSISMFALRGNENVPLAGTHAKWIERLDLTGADYAMPFYNWLVENSDNDGAEDALIEPTATSGTVVNSDGTYYYTLKEFTGEVEFTFTPGETQEQIKAAGREAAGQELSAQENFDEAAKYATAVYSAFDRDYPQVFWLSGESTVISSVGYSYTYTAGNGTGTATYTQTVGFLLKKESAEDAFDIRATDYQQPETIRTTIQSLDSKVTQIMNGAESTTYDKVKYFNEWLTKNNCYNSNLATAGHDVRECISALSGRTDTDGPVCEGYARAFKVLCDKAGIPCVLVSGNADNGSGTPEAHMWNYVQIDGKWYAVDVTWNDPSVQGVTGAVSNHEREDYLLVGSNTSIGEKEFATSHVMTNTVTENGVAFTNEPAIEETAYVPAASTNEEPELVEGYYQIANASNLYWFADYVNAGNISANAILTDDIIVNTGDVANCEGVKKEDWREWFPIGYYSDRGNIFYSGEFNGNGKTISGLYFNNETQAYVGLFGQTEASAQIKNLGIVNSYFKGKDRVGSVCGYSTGKIDNCYNTGTVVGVNGAAGGVCGDNNRGTITNCYSIGTVSGDDNGVCGDNNSGTITNCYYLADSETDSHEGTTFKTQDQFASGEVAYLLNGSSSEDVDWYQAIGTDSYPALNSTRGIVYYGYLHCTDTNKQYTNNSNASDAIPEHNYEYTATNDTITASCATDGCNVVGGTIVISASGKTYNGVSVTATVVNTIDNTDYSSNIVYKDSKGTEVAQAVNAGTYTANITVGGATAKVDFTIAKANPVIAWNDQTVSCTGAKVVITAPTLTFVGEDNPSVNMTYSYSVHGEEDYTNGLPSSCGTYDVKVNVSATDNYNETEGSITLTITEIDADSDGKCDYCDLEEENGYFQIKNAGNLYWFAEYVNAGHTTANAILVDDITINPGEMTVNGQGEVKFDGNAPTYIWTPIGTASNSYKGTFNGNGYTISGLYMNDPAEDNDNVALFGYVAEGGEVKDICVANSYFSGNQSVGTIVGYNNGSLKNCSNWNSMVVGSGNNIGGITGYNAGDGTVTNCFNAATVKSVDINVGGVVGYNSRGIVSNSYNTGTVQSSDKSVGGIVGTNYNGRITDCYNTGTVQGDSSYVGAITSVNHGGEVTNCYYLEGCATDGNGVTQYGIGANTKGSTTTDVADDTTSVTNEQFAGGEVAYLLNDSTSVGELAWYQTIGTDTYPVLDTTHKIVYYGYLHCYDTAKQYTNDSNASDTLPDHNITYTAEDETITASCGTDGCTKVFGTIVISASDKIYDGTAVTATIANNIDATDYSSQIVYMDSEEKPVTQVVNAGTYTANLTVNGATAKVEFTIGKATPTANVSGKTLTYNGVARELVTVDTPAPEGCTIMYIVEGLGGGYDAEIPVGINAGEYEIRWKISGGQNYADAEGGNVSSVINKAAPTVDMFTYTAPVNLDYDGNVKAATVAPKDSIAGMGEITVKYYKDDVEIEPINAGTYTVKIAVAEGRNYTAVTNLPINTFTINKAQATITVETTPIEVNLGDAAFNLNATENNTDDEAALTYASSNDAVVRVSSDGTVTVEGVGTATITVSLGASTNYKAATSKEINITVNRVILSEMEINKNYLYSRVNADRIDLAAMLTEDCGTVEYVSVTDEGQLFFASESARPNVDSEGILTYTLEAGNVGETGIITVVAETQNYGTITIKVNITLIDPMPVSIRDDGEVEVYNNTLTYGEKVSVLTFIPVEFVDEDGNVVEGTLAWQEPDAIPTVGTSEVAWVFTPEDDAFALLEGTVSIVVNKANSVVTAAPTPKSGLTYNGDVQQLINEGTATGGEMQYSLDATTWNTTIPTAKDAGAYTVYYKVAGDANHNDIEQKTIKVTIAQKDIADASVDFNESFIYDGTAHEPVSIAVKLDDTSLTEADYTISGYANNINAGTASITIAGKGNYTGTVTKNFTISKASASAVVAPTAANISYGQSLAHATLSDNAWSWVDETIIPVSSNKFEAYIQVDDSNYDYTGVQGYDRDNHRIVRNVQVILNKADITITAKSYSIKAGDTMPAFEYEVTGLPNGEVLPVAVSVSCTATNSSTAGTYDITVSGPVSTDLYVITYVPGTLEITRNAQTITAGDVTLTYGDADKKITATTDGDGTFTYTVAEGSRDVISVASDGTITTLKAGEATVLITASETGAYTKTEKTIKVIVNKATLSVSSAEAADRAYDGTKTVDITAVGLNGVVGTDVVSVALSGVRGILSSANAGTYDSVSLSGLSLTGAAAGNYILPENAANVSFRREVTISKAENAPNMPAATMNVPNGVLKVGGATLPAGWTWQDADKDTELEVGVVCNAVAVYTGADAGNYANVTVTIAITRAQPVAAPSTPVSTPAPEPNKPFIQGEAGKNGWDVIRAETGNAKTGDTVVVNMNGATEVPGQVFDDIKGKDVTVTLDLGNGISWTINGKTITADNVSDINFGVKIGTVENPVNTIPVDIVNRLTGARKSVNISLSHNGEFGLKAILNIDLGKANAGLFANLFYYDKAKRKMEFIWADEIGTNGMAHLLFTHASDYTIVLDKEVLNATGGLSPNTGDSANPWAMVLLMCMFFSVGAGTLWIRSRKDEMAE